MEHSSHRVPMALTLRFGPTSQIKTSSTNVWRL